MALANSLNALPKDPSLDSIRVALGTFYNERHKRVNEICNVANLETLDSPLLKFVQLANLRFYPIRSTISILE